MKRCIVCTKLVWWRVISKAEFRPGHWVCTLRCWRVAASAVELGLDFIYLPADA